ncbi:methylenetetrahydrofolate reductase, partial [Actinotalea ferrariae]|nr:methylenetetrahydrofolate reductase [Actinotalea ferrariae]
VAVGRALGAELAAGVLAAGAPGLHLYTFNQHRAALDLLHDVGLRTRVEPAA